MQHKMFVAAQEIQNRNVEKNIESGEEVKFYFERLLKFDNALMLLTSMNMSLTILYVSSG